MALINIGLLVVNLFQACSTKHAADAAKSAATTATNQLRLSERPWLSIKGISVIALTYPNGPERPRIRLEYQVENLGHGIAPLIGVFSEITTERHGITTEDYLKNGCDKTAALKTSNDGLLGVMPSRYPVPYDLLFSDELADGRSPMPGLKLTSADMSDLPTIRNSGCVIYRSMTDSDIHRTPFTARLTIKVNGKCPGQNEGDRIHFSARPSEKDLCFADLLIVESPHIQID